MKYSENLSGKIKEIRAKDSEKVSFEHDCLKAGNENEDFREMFEGISAENFSGEEIDVDISGRELFIMSKEDLLNSLEDKNNIKDAIINARLTDMSVYSKDQLRQDGYPRFEVLKNEKQKCFVYADSQDYILMGVAKAVQEYFELCEGMELEQIFPAEERRELKNEFDAEIHIVYEIVEKKDVFSHIEIVLTHKPKVKSR